MQNFNYHGHTYRCGHAHLDMKDEESIFLINDDAVKLTLVM